MSYTPSTKITKGQMKELVKSGAMPKDVFDFVVDWAKENHIRTWHIKAVDGSYKVYFAEDMHYTMFYRGESAAHQCGGEWSGYKSRDLVNTRMEVPAGTWVVETGFFCGHPVIHIVNVGPKAIG